MADPSDIATLIEAARPYLGEVVLSRPEFTAGTVACALRSGSGKISTGVCVDLACGVGFCAEHAAVAEMLKGRETRVAAIVAIGEGGVLTPCGRCRELLVQVDERNLDAQVGLPGGRVARLRDLIPDHWLARG